MPHNRHSRESGNPERKDWIPGQARNDRNGHKDVVLLMNFLAKVIN